MYVLNDKIKDLKPYDPISGDYKIRLDANESFLSVPASLAAKIMDAAAFTTFNRYPNPTARGVCEAFAAQYGVAAENVTAGNGSDELISLLISAFLMKGDSVITLSPDFSMYRFYASTAEAKCIELVKNPDMTIDVDELIAIANRQRARMIVFSNPCNPTSLGLAREQVRRLLRSVDALVVLDEAYMDFWDQSLLPEVEQYDNLVILRTCSKAFGMAAIRLGFAVANPTITHALKAVKSPYNVNAVTQAIGAVVLSQSRLAGDALKKIITSRDELYVGLSALARDFPGKLTVYESRTNFVFLKTPDARRIYDSLLKDSIAVRFLGDYLRITAGARAENAALLAALQKIL